MEQFSLSGNAFFDTLPQPIILTTEHIVIYFNQAAAETFADEPTPLREGISLPEDMDSIECGGTASVPLNSGTWLVQVQSIDAGLLFRMERLPSEEALSCYRLRSLSEHLRRTASRMLNAAEMMQNSMVETERERVKTYLSYFNQSYYQLLRFTENLDTYSSAIVDPNAIFMPEVLDLSRLCSDLAYQVEEPASHLGRKVEFNDGNQSVLIQGDKVLLTRMIFQLIQNAFQSGGDVVLRLKRQRGRAILMCCDNGAGLSTEQFRNPFDPNLTDESALHQGMGLGLAICKSIVQLHNGGTITLTPLNPGTMVTVAFPLCSEQNANHLQSIPPFDLLGGFAPVLVELSDVLPWECYIPENVE